MKSYAAQDWRCPRGKTNRPIFIGIIPLKIGLFKCISIYTKHYLKFGKNQADNLAYIGFRRRFFPVFYWCLVLHAQGLSDDVEISFRRSAPQKPTRQQEDLYVRRK